MRRIHLRLERAMGGEQNIEAFEFGGERTDGVEQVHVDGDQVPLRGGVAAGM